MRSSNIVLFDFDGVICDSLTTVLAIHKKADTTFEVASYLKGFEGNIHDHPSKLSAGEFFAAFGPQVAKQTLFPGIDGVIQNLARLFTLVIVSSTTSQPIQEFLRYNKLDSYFAEVLGADVNPSKVIKFQMVMEKYQVRGDQCVLITDTLGDLREAQKVSIPTIAVTWGYHPLETLQKGQPNAVASQPAEIPKLVKTLFQPA